MNRTCPDAHCSCRQPETLEQLASDVAHEINTPAQYLADNARFLEDAFVTLLAAVEAGAELLKAANANSLAPGLHERAAKMFDAHDLQFCREQVPAALAEMRDGIARITDVVRELKAAAAAAAGPSATGVAKSPVKQG